MHCCRAPYLHCRHAPYLHCRRRWRERGRHWAANRRRRGEWGAAERRRGRSPSWAAVGSGWARARGPAEGGGKGTDTCGRDGGAANRGEAKTKEKKRRRKKKKRKKKKTKKRTKKKKRKTKKKKRTSRSVWSWPLAIAIAFSAERRGVRRGRRRAGSLRSRKCWRRRRADRAETAAAPPRRE